VCGVEHGAVAKDFRRADRAQTFLLPPDMRDWLPADHLVWFLLEVLEELDLSRFEAAAKLGAAGRAPFDPSTLLGILIYGYALGQRSSRQLERLCQVDVAFRVLAGNAVPDHTTLARFRQRHEAAVTDLFTQVLLLCARAGLGRLGIVAIDGTKIAADASAQANRCEQALREQLRRRAEQAVSEAAEVDEAEDEQYGSARGDELPPQWRSGDRRSRIRAALRDLEADTQRRRTRELQEQAGQQDRAAQYLQRVDEVSAGRRARAGRPPTAADRVLAAQQRLAQAQTQAVQRQQHWQDKQTAAAAQGRAVIGRPPTAVEQHWHVRRASQRLEQAQANQARAEQAAAERAAAERAAAAGKVAAPAKASPVRNITDPDSRLMPTRNGWVQGFNAQLAVADDQIILAARLVQTPGDVEQFIPTVAAAQAAAELICAARNDGDGRIGTVVADAGYLSQANLTADGPDRLIALGKRREQERQARDQPTSGPAPQPADARAAMAHRLRTEQGITTYRRRGVTVEPVNGHLKDRIGLRRFSRRGLAAAASELQLAATVANLLKLHRIQTA
jgi:transposase